MKTDTSETIIAGMSTQILVPDALRQLALGKGFLSADIGETEPQRLFAVREPAGGG